MKLHESRFLQVLLLAGTLWVPVFMLLFVGFVVGAAFFGFMEDWEPEEGLPVFIVLLFLMMVTGPIGLIVSTTYLFLVLKSDRVPEEKRKAWLVAILLGAPVTMPIFFFRYVWKAPVPGR